ncbi:DUF2470 domain-containing protein [Mycobacterium koreense]|uniref:DUF2470 domain-containing protein n=1 Tax=Mycolicibacillus koreensis TaxID=1069220 RepID=A0A7I7SGE7_9MYCO|nr:DUF2470 domain-containing protein [Mycolicibacillus koreensis]MCV7249582.1 DUF2470 domain-containing protein [Mycolicibacillus koreensis]ODR06514.1 DUF2470 domain-containing protein [Mycolicibacillus koreensis]OSC33557.1 DUF2470 domain-containing protein [Mycolicibacillus koreensis]BBY56017.1 prephenate dehydratase [Mycolicibacillus koreensis]
MIRTDAPTPSTAERIRSVCLRAGHALLAVDGLAPLTTPVQHLLDDGTFAVAVPSVAAVPDGTAVMLELTDEAALPLRKPVRSLVWVRGELTAVPAADVTELLDVIARTDPRPALLTVATPQCGPDAEHTLMRLKTASVVVADAAGAESVDVATVVAATPDPFCALEAHWLRHLDAAHPEMVARLAARLPPRWRRGAVRPLALDRYGVSLRIEDADGDHDIRLPFHQPADDPRSLSQALRVLMGCPFVNGLRARRGTP